MFSSADLEYLFIVNYFPKRKEILLILLQECLLLPRIRSSSSQFSFPFKMKRKPIINGDKSASFTRQKCLHKVPSIYQSNKFTKEGWGSHPLYVSRSKPFISAASERAFLHFSIMVLESYRGRPSNVFFSSSTQRARA
jgi:hypothetical protein